MERPGRETPLLNSSGVEWRLEAINKDHIIGGGNRLAASPRFSPTFALTQTVTHVDMIVWRPKLICKAPSPLGISNFLPILPYPRSNLVSNHSFTRLWKDSHLRNSMPSGHTAIRSNASPRPHRISNRLTLGLTWIPAPTSPIAGASSRIVTL